MEGTVPQKGLTFLTHGVVTQPLTECRSAPPGECDRMIRAQQRCDLFDDHGVTLTALV